MENLDFGRGHGRNFDHLTMVHGYVVILAMVMVKNFRPHDHDTRAGRKPYGQKIMVALPAPPPLSVCFAESKLYSY